MNTLPNSNVYRDFIVLKTWQKGGTLTQLICHKVTASLYIYKPVGNKTSAMRPTNHKIAGFILMSNLLRY